MSRVVHFEIHASDPVNLAEFYRNVFDWEIKKTEGMDYWLISTGPEDQPGINGGMLLRRGELAGEDHGMNAFVCTVQVENLDEIVKRVIENGGKQTVETNDISGVGKFAYFKDSDGNQFGVLQPA